MFGKYVYKQYNCNNNDLHKQLPTKSFPVKIPSKIIMNNKELSYQKYSLNSFNPHNPCSPNSWNRRLFTRLSQKK